MFFGVERLYIIIPDFFHIDNIAINRASQIFSGNPERGNFSQFHPRQLLQSIHDLNSRNPEMSQQIIDDILNQIERPNEYILRTRRERPQRWRVNGLFAKEILAAFDIVDEDGLNLIYRWAEVMHVLGGKVGGDDCQWMKDTARQIMVMARSKVIEISLTFEMELVSQYFDITHCEHAYNGEYNRRAGFITQELHRLYFDFVIPFWLTASKDPAKCFPETHARIMELEDEELKKMKLEQLTEAIEEALDRVSKNSELLLEPPLVFLLLSHPVEGPCILKAIIACIANEGFDLDDPDNIYFDEYCEVILNPEEKWCQLTYKTDEDRASMSPKVRAYFEQLLPERKKALHFFRQFGFCRALLRAELLSLYNETGISEEDYDDTDTPLADFNAKYPLISEALSSAFQWSASNSRIVELLHAFVRACYDPNMSLECLDSRLNMLMGDEFLQRDERKDLFRKNRDKTLTYRPPKHLDRKKTQQMQGEQLLRNAAKYSTELINNLPDDIKEQIKIRNINRQGHTLMEKKYEDELRTKWEERHARKQSHRTFNPIDSTVIDEEAKAARSAHDISWHKRGDIKYASVVEKMATKNHFKSIKVTDGFYEKLCKSYLLLVSYSLLPLNL
jgi:hypothetical protein